MLNYCDKNVCSVTKEFVEQTANLYKEYLIKDGEINLYATLFALGFYIDRESYHKGVYKVEDVYVRCLDVPSKVYPTTVYNGNIRRAVKSVKNGYIKFDKHNYHCLKPIYDKYEVLQPFDVSPYVDENLLKDILEIGDWMSYNKE